MSTEPQGTSVTLPSLSLSLQLLFPLTLEFSMTLSKQPK